MKRPVLPAEEKLNRPPSESAPTSGDALKRKPKLVFHQGNPAYRPEDMDKRPIPMPELKPAAEMPVETPVPAAADAILELPQPVAAEVPAALESQPAHRPELNPGRRLHAFETAGKNAPRARVPWHYRLRPNRELTHRAFWDVTATLSLIINLILVIVLVVMAQQIENLKTTISGVNTFANNVLGGLYGNFVQMDQASINTTINVEAQVPLDFNLPVSQNTQVVLTSDVSIPRAHVVISTGVLNINADANVTLPAGTNLPIALNMNIPVQTSIPISLQVPVHIPLSQTELHQPFTGLQASLRPLYCALNKNAQYPEGTYICTEHDATTPGVP